MHDKPNVSAYTSSTSKCTVDGLKPGLGSIGSELDHLLGQFLRQPARKSLIWRDNAQFDGYNAASSNPDTNGIRIPERDIVRFPEICLSQ